MGETEGYGGKDLGVEVSIEMRMEDPRDVNNQSWIRG